MNFRQRMAWLCLAFYLASSVAVVYYFLDIADQYALFSLEHSKLHDSSDSDVPFWQFWHHIGDIPFPVLVILLAVPYFQIFAALFYCTLPTANKNVNKCLIPVIGCIYLFQKFFSVFRNHEDTKIDSRHDHHHIVSVSWLLFSIMILIFSVKNTQATYKFYLVNFIPCLVHSEWFYTVQLSFPVFTC